jgi:protein-disulfide isomerase
VRPTLAADSPVRSAATGTPTAAPSATPTKQVPAAATEAITPAVSAGVSVTATEVTSESVAVSDTSGPPADALPVIAAKTSVKLADLAEYDGKPVGFTDAGFPFMGDPNAPVTMVEYSDYLCPFCGRHVMETLPTLIDEYIQTGKLKLVFRDFPIEALHPNAPQGHQAAWCVGGEDPVAYWAMHDQLFSRQSEWNQVADPTEFLASAAAAAGADSAAYTACMDSGETIANVNDGIAEGQSLGFSGTPSFVFFTDTLPKTYTVVGAYPLDYFRQYIDALLAGEEPPADPQAQAAAPQLPAWASQEFLASDPDKPGFNLYGDHTLGSDDAKLTIVEFSDMQCPACAEYANLVAPEIFKQFVDTGKVRWVFKHRPLPMHPFAPIGAAATECASDQGQFWEMHDALFADQETWAGTDGTWTEAQAEKALVGIAKELGLDDDSFSKCINSRQPLERVLYDLYDAEGVISSTPSFVALYGDQGTLLNGSRSAEEFAQVLNSLIEAAQ